MFLVSNFVTTFLKHFVIPLCKVNLLQSIFYGSRNGTRSFFLKSSKKTLQVRYLSVFGRRDYGRKSHKTAALGGTYPFACLQADLHVLPFESLMAIFRAKGRKCDKKRKHFVSSCSLSVSRNENRAHFIS